MLVLELAKSTGRAHLLGSIRAIGGRLNRERRNKVVDLVWRQTYLLLRVHLDSLVIKLNPVKPAKLDKVSHKTIGTLGRLRKLRPGLDRRLNLAQVATFLAKLKDTHVYFAI